MHLSDISTDWRTQINNLGTKYRLNIQWDEGCVGPQNNCTWRVVVYGEHVHLFLEILIY